MKEVNRIKLESLKKENMKKKGYIGEYPMNLFSVVFMFESYPSCEQVVEAIERHFNSHYKYYLENFGGVPQFISYKRTNMKSFDKPISDIVDDVIYIKADFLVQLDMKNLNGHNQREEEFEAWIDEYMSINGSDADIERFGTEVNTIHQLPAFVVSKNVFKGKGVLLKNNADKMKPFSKAVSKGYAKGGILEFRPEDMKLHKVAKASYVGDYNVDKVEFDLVASRIKKTLETNLDIRFETMTKNDNVLLITVVIYDTESNVEKYELEYLTLIDTILDGFKRILVIE